MHIRTVLILWIIALVLRASVFALKKAQGNEHKNATNRKPGETLLPEFPAEKTESIKISGANTSVTLNKSEGKWVVTQRDNYPANTAKINDLLRSLAQIKVTQGIEAGPSLAPRFGMDTNSSEASKRGLTVTLKGTSDNLLAKVSFGKNLEASAAPSPFGGSGATGRYVRNHADESGFYAVSELFSSLSAEPKDWLDEDFFKIDKIKTISVTKPGSDDIEWTLTRADEDAGFAFGEAFPGVKISPPAVAPLSSLFSYARFEDVVPSSELKARANPEKLRKVSIKTFEGLDYEIALQPAQATADASSYLLSVQVSGQLPEQRKAAETEDKAAAAAADKAFEQRRKSLQASLEQVRELEGITFEVSKSTVSALLKERTELMDKGPGPQGSSGQPQSRTQVYSPPIEIPINPKNTAPEDGE